MPSPFHRGDYKRVRHAVTIAMLELESLEPRMLLAHKRELIPASVVANLSLARLMVCEVDQLLRNSLDAALADTGKYHDVYAETRFTDRDLVA